MDDGVLHERDEPRRWLPAHGLVSLLDILGGGDITCDDCGRWQSFSALSRETAREELARSGWTFDGGTDRCPRCRRTDLEAL